MTKDYLTVLGNAVYRWASLEWHVICLLREHRPGISTKDLAHLGGGQIGRIFQDECGGAVLSQYAAEFLALKERRNDLMHSRPAKISEETDGLHRWILEETKKGTKHKAFSLDIEWLTGFAADCDKLSRVLNQLLHSKENPFDASS